GGAIQGERARYGELFTESASVEPFHDDVGDPVGGPAGVFDVRDVLVIQVADNSSLTLKQVDHPVIADRHVGLQNFEGHPQTYPQVIRVVHGAHAADADERLDTVFVCENLPDEAIWVRQRELLIVLRTCSLPPVVTSQTPGTVFYGAPVHCRAV